jgi:hypothetical protein
MLRWNGYIRLQQRELKTIIADVKTANNIGEKGVNKQEIQLILQYCYQDFRGYANFFNQVYRSDFFENKSFNAPNDHHEFTIKYVGKKVGRCSLRNFMADNDLIGFLNYQEFFDWFDDLSDKAISALRIVDQYFEEHLAFSEMPPPGVYCGP